MKQIFDELYEAFEQSKLTFRHCVAEYLKETTKDTDKEYPVRDEHFKPLVLLRVGDDLYAVKCVIDKAKTFKDEPCVHICQMDDEDYDYWVDASYFGADEELVLSCIQWDD